MPNRAALERAADKMSADGVVFNNVYDNGYSNNQVIFSLRDAKTGELLAFIEGEEDDDMLDEQPSNNT